METLKNRKRSSIFC